MDNIVQEFLDRYEIIVAEKIAMQGENLNHISKEKALSLQIEELSRTVTVLQKTLKCHNDFLDSGELREDFEKFKDKWIEEEQKNAQ